MHASGGFDFGFISGHEVNLDHQHNSNDLLITADDDFGDRTVGRATVDTTNCGHPDTVTATGPDHSTLLYTDTNGDGVADYRTQITQDNHFAFSEHIGPHQWVITERGHLDPHGIYVRDSDLTPDALLPESPEISGSDTDGDTNPITGAWTFLV